MADESLWFVPHEIHCQELWQCVRLIAPSNEQRKWTTKDAVGAYCTLCKKAFPKYTAGSTTQIRRHMESFHSNMLSERPKRRVGPVFDFFAAKRRQNSEDAPAEGVNDLFRNWISKDSRAVEILQDESFLKLIKRINEWGDYILIPPVDIIRTEIQEKSEALMTKIKTMIDTECDYYSLSCKVAHLASREIYVRIVLHYATSEYKLRVITLTCTTVPCEESIPKLITRTIQEFNLDMEKLIVLTSKRFETLSNEPWMLQQQQCMASLLEEVMDRWFRNESGLQENGSLSKLVEVRDHFHAYFSFLRKNPVAGNWLRSRLPAEPEEKEFYQETPTAWLSMYFMFKSALEMKTSFSDFISYVASNEGQNEFPTSVTLPEITKNHWWFLEQVFALLSPFFESINFLSNEKYPTWSITIPTLRLLKRQLEQYFVATNPTPNGWVNADRALMNAKMDISKSLDELLQSVEQHLYWTILLDPRMAHTSVLSEDETSKARSTIIAEMTDISKSGNSSRVTNDQTNKNSPSIPGSSVNPFHAQLFHTPLRQTSRDLTTTIKSELDLYFVMCQPESIRHVDPLVWWSDKKTTFPTLSALARRWVSAISVSESCDGLFSSAGLVVQQREAGLLAKNIESTVLLHDNEEFL